MANSTVGDVKNVHGVDVDVLLHPELLSREFLRLLLSERKIGSAACESRDGLTELYLRHVVPLPQRTLPNNRWGRKVERSGGRQSSHSSSNDQMRKRPLIVFDGSSSHSGSLKLKKAEGTTGTIDRLKPPPAASLSNPIRKLSGSSSSSSPSLQTSASDGDAANLKRQANNSGVLKSPEMKKKIQHVTWP
ncbi:ashwin [Genypterus blacodes]|uniref:ashwin n=1 Tax=Genypterus blacodes TaxID=154954 RepID=UPI003F776427